MKVISEFYLFFFQKNHCEVGKWKTHEKFKCIITLLILNYIFLLLITAIKHILIQYNLITPLVDNYNNLRNGYKLIFFYIILGPLLEETAFRLWILYNKSAIALSSIVLLYFILGKFHFYKNPDTARIIISFLTALCLFAIFYIALKYHDGYLKKIWNKNLRIFIIVSAVTFGYMHITNFKITGSILIFSPLILAPIIFGGVVLGYIRVKLGFKYAYLAHAIQNLIPTLFFIFFV